MSKEHKDNPNINKFIHPPIVALFWIIISYLIGRYIPLTIPSSTITKIIGLGLIIIALGFAFSAFNEFRKLQTTLDPHGSVKTLATNGVYKLSRNPIYLGFLLMVIGFPLYSGYYSGVIIAAFFLISMNRLVIEKEEAYLEEKFGEVYKNYKSKVRRWL